LGLLSLSEHWVVNNIEYARLVRSLRENRRITSAMPLGNLTVNVPENSNEIIRYIEKARKNLAVNITQEDWDKMTLPKFVSLMGDKISPDQKQLLLDLEKPSMWSRGDPIIGFNAIQRMYRNKHAWDLFGHYRTDVFPYRVNFKTWKDVQVMKDELDFLVIRHYELYGVKLPSDNPRLFSNTVATPKFGGQPEITSFGVIDPPLPKKVVETPVVEPPVVVVADPSGLHPDVKWMVLGVIGVGLLFAIILLRRK
jgi:hypothetical protein